MAKSASASASWPNYAEPWLLRPDHYRAFSWDEVGFSVYFNRGYEYSMLNLDEQAIEDYDKAIQQTPNFVDAYAHRGYSYMQLGYYGRVVKDFDKVIQLDPFYKNP